MPLKLGTSRKVIESNIREMLAGAHESKDPEPDEIDSTKTLHRRLMKHRNGSRHVPVYIVKGEKYGRY